MKRQKITKANIVENIYGSSELQKRDILRVVDELFEELKSALKNDMVIELRGFGTFEVRTRKGRPRARNPKTGELTPVDTHGVAVFRPGKEIKSLVWMLRK